MELKDRKVTGWRCQIDPMIGNPANAFMVGQKGIMDAELCPAGIWVKWKNPSPGNALDEVEHVIPYANIQSIRLAGKSKEASAPIEAPKRGRPFATPQAQTG